MTVRTNAFAALALCFAIGIVAYDAHAQDRPTTPCDTLLQQQPMNACWSGLAQQSIALLDTLVAQLRPQLPPGQRTALDSIQGAWLPLTQADCQWQSAFVDGGSMQATVYWSCIDDATWYRIDSLKVHLCEGGGMTGPCENSQAYDRATVEARWTEGSLR